MSKEIENAISYLKLFYNNGVNAYIDSSAISPEVAKELYNLDYDTYMEKVGIPKVNLFFFLDPSEQLKHLDDLDNFGTLDSFNIPSNYFYRNDEFYSKLLQKIFYSKLLNSSFQAFKYLESIQDEKCFYDAFYSYVLNYHDREEVSTTIRLMDKLSDENKYKFLNSLFNEISYIDPALSDMIGILSNDTAIKVIDDIFNMNDEKIKDLIISSEFISALADTDVDRKYLSNKLLSKSYLYDDINKINHIANSIALLSAEGIAEYVSKNMPSEEQFITIYRKISSSKKEQIHNLLKNNPEYASKYYTPDYFEILGDSIPPQEALEILNTHVLKEDSIFNDIDKCAFIYNTLSDNKLLAIDTALANPYGKEAITQYFYELIEDDEINAKEILNYPNIKNLMFELGVDPKRMDNLVSFIDRYKNLAIKYIKNPNIVNLINMEPEKYNKFLSLFDSADKTFDMGKVNTIANAMLQRKFRLEHKEDCTMFATIQNLLNERNTDNLNKVLSLISKMNSTIDVASMCDGMDAKEFVGALFKHNENAINILHNITDAYIAKKREIYLSLNYDNFISKLNINKKYNRQYIKKAFIKYNNLQTIYRTISNLQYQRRINLSDEEIAICNNVTSLEDVISFKKDPNSITLTNDMIQKMKILDGLLEKAHDINALRLPLEPEDAKFTYSTIKADDDDILNIISEINTKHVRETILDNEELFNSLNNLIKKYSIFSWTDTFTKLQAECDLTIDDSTTSAIVTYYDKIENFLKTTGKNGITDILDIAGLYASSSNKYVKLLNEDNYRLIVANPGPNQSSMPKVSRLAIIPKYIKDIYNRDTITVPSGEKIVDLGDNRKLKVSVGDVYNHDVLTYGERTGACLRIGGAFNDLFDYCLKDKNGFHISITDPITGAFVSRVSGIRNGNTIFLNELRNSVLEEYNNEDIIKALNEISRLLVESTRNDPHPIENIIISNDYAMGNKSTGSLHIPSHQEAFGHLNFNINTTGHVLYTANKDPKELMPYKFGDEYVSSYRPYNTKVVHTSPSNILSHIEQIYIINKLLKGEDIENIDLPEINVDDIKDCIYGNGWVALVDNDGNIHEVIVDTFKDNEELLKLINDAEEKYLGGNKNGKKNGKNNRV